MSRPVPVFNLSIGSGTDLECPDRGSKQSAADAEDGEQWEGDWCEEGGRTSLSCPCLYTIDAISTSAWTSIVLKILKTAIAEGLLPVGIIVPPARIEIGLALAASLTIITICVRGWVVRSQFQGFGGGASKENRGLIRDLGLAYLASKVDSPQF
jgi:hypothetical protein